VRVLTNYHGLFREVCLSSPYPSETCMLAVVLKSISCSQHSELLLYFQGHLFPLLLKPLSKRSTFPLALRGTRVVFLLFKQFSCKLETEAEAILTLLIKLIGGGTDAGEPRPAWADEGPRDGGHAQVRPPLYLVSGSLAYWWPCDALSVYTVCVQAL
jgi:hypothetical protein